MKNRLIKTMTAGVLAAVLSVSAVWAAPSITAGVTVVDKEITADSGITDAQGTPVTSGTIEVVKTVNDETKATEIITPVKEEVKAQIETINNAIQEAAEKGDMKAYTEAIRTIVEEKQVEYADTTDTFKVENCAPLTNIQDVVVKDADGNVVEGAKNVDVKIEVPNLTKAIKDIRILHYDIEKEKWVVIEPEIDYETKTLKFHLDVVGPIMVVYDPETVEAE